MTADPEAVVPCLLAWRRSLGMCRFAYRWARCLCVSLAWLAASLQSHPLAGAQTKEVRRILILYEAGIQWPAIALINDALGESLQGTKYHIEIYREYMESRIVSRRGRSEAAS